MKILKVKIYQPQAHYRIPYTFQRRHTYPIPPYSTIIGFLCNLLGIYDQREEIYTEGIKKIMISIGGKFEIKNEEVIWFRNLKKEKHIQRFGYLSNRSTNGHIEHIGGQSQMHIDVLEEVHLIIYLSHENQDFLEKIKNNLENPINRLEVLHIGRAEDWIVLEDSPKYLADAQIEIKRRDADYNNFFWIPESLYDSDSRNFEEIDGLLYNIPSFATIDDYETTLNHNGARQFEYIRSKLNDGLIKETKLMLDISDILNPNPIFLCNLN